MATEVAPGVHRLGNEMVNFYVVEADGGLTMVDAGLPGFRDQLEAFLRERGNTLADIDALLLTHAHGDHVGLAETARAAAVPVHIHEADADQARTGKSHPREGGVLRYLRYPTTWRLLLMAMRNGAMRPVKVASVSTFADGAQLDVPGRPRVIHTPGHSPGEVVFHFEGNGSLLVGDALCTWNPLTGRPGPQVMPAAFSLSSAQMLASLDRIESIEAALLPGHGDPWTGGTAAAVARAREAGPS